MDIDGLAKFLALLKSGGELDDFELIAIERTDAGQMRYSVTIALGPLQYVISSWMPAELVRRDIIMRAAQVGILEESAEDYE